jgi:hypothetical protein
MKFKNLGLFTGALALLVQTATADEFKTRVVASGLDRPTGIVAGADELYFAEIPNPAMPNAGGHRRADGASIRLFDQIARRVGRN